ncbi:gastrula zinc finger protein xFG20-1-like isoform X1 [Thunnus albacares]|uniref:gastrula zinc finger protein xFG20-1-like isoform X1 n=2 Tax=Thunnus albacares TaxID=8236 RepID=UPI001CF64DD6|nr:gastrula zinc finger protein xFG20-1-like isoform X1 [Thunnus albacares]
MSKVQMLRASVTQRLTAAAEEIFVLFERSIAEYEEELSRSKKENERQRKLLDAVFNPQLQLHRADIQQLSESKEEVPPEQQEWSSSLDQEDPEPPHIKEEQEELLTSQEREQLQGLIGVDIPSSPLSVKSPRKTENREAEPTASSSTEQMETEADGEDCEGSEPARNSDPGRHLQPDSPDKISDPSETDVSDDDLTETREPQSDLNSMKNKEILVSDMKFNTGNNSFICSQCGKKFASKVSLQRHMTLSHHTGMDLFSCELCDKTFTHKIYLKIHMGVHTGEKRYRCHICEKRFTWRIQLRRHKCADKSSQLNGGETKPVRNSVRISELRCRDAKNSSSSFSCSKCKEKFDNFYSLERHEKAHSEKKPFSCPFCGKSFAHRAHLTPHVAMHTGERPYRCRYCYRSFTWPSQVKKHKCGREKYYKLYQSRIKEKRAAALQGLEEADITQFTVTPVPVKSEDDEDKPQSSQLHPSQTEENREAEPPASSSTEQMETEADGEDCGGSEPARNSHPDRLLQPDTDDRTLHFPEPDPGPEVREDEWKVTREPQSGLQNVPVSSMSLTTLTKRFTCCQCGETFDKKISLVRHMKHHAKKQFSCSLCGKEFVHKETLEAHKKWHEGHTDFSCSLCGRKFKYLGQLSLHLNSHEEINRFKCSICDRTFNIFYAFKRHKCNGESSKLHKPGTSQEGEQLQGLEDADTPKFTFTPLPVNSEDDDEEKHQSSQFHQRQYEQTNTEVDGEDCGGSEPASNSHPDRHLPPDTDDREESSQQKEPKSLSQHMIIHSQVHREAKQEDPGSPHIKEEQEELWTCREGEQPQGPPASRLAEQMKTEANGPDRHLQPVSDLKVLNAFQLKTVNVVCMEIRAPQLVFISQKKNVTPVSNEGYNIDEKPFSCQKCGKGFSRNDVLKKHMRTHTGEKPFCCSICGKRFTQNSHVKQHMTVHKGETQFSCGVCNKRFIWNFQLKNHKCVGESSQLHQRQTEENREAEPTVSSTTEQIETKANGEECEEPEPNRNSDLNSEKNKIPVSDERAKGEKPFSCSICGTKSASKRGMKLHIKRHFAKKRFSCSYCDKRFSWYRELKRHECDKPPELEIEISDDEE